MRPRLCSEQLDVSGVLLDVQAETCFRRYEKSVVEADHRGHEVLNVELVFLLLYVRGALPGENDGFQILSCAELAEGRTEYGDGLRISAEVAGEIDDVNAEVDQRDRRRSRTCRRTSCRGSRRGGDTIPSRSRCLRGIPCL